jgi:hypothetical protein
MAEDLETLAATLASQRARRNVGIIDQLQGAWDPNVRGASGSVASFSSRNGATSAEVMRLAANTKGPVGSAALKHLLDKAYRGAPRLLHTLWVQQRITLNQLRDELGQTWSRCGRPNDVLPDDQWRQMFRATGFMSYGSPATPTNARLYRGSRPGLRAYWSWTSEPLIAAIYASTVGTGTGRVNGWAGWDGCVWMVDAPAESLLWHQPLNLDCETVRGRTATIRSDQFVLDTDGLDIELYLNTEQTERLVKTNAVRRMGNN